MVKILGVSLPSIQQIASSPWTRRAGVVTAVATGAIFALGLYDYARSLKNLTKVSTDVSWTGRILDLLKRGLWVLSSQTSSMSYYSSKSDQHINIDLGFVTSAELDVIIQNASYFSDKQLDQFWSRSDDLQTRRNFIKKMYPTQWTYVHGRYQDKWKESLKGLTVGDVRQLLQKWAPGTHLPYLIQYLDQETVNPLVQGRVDLILGLTVDQLNNLSDDAKQSVLQQHEIVGQLSVDRLEAVIGFTHGFKEIFGLMSQLSPSQIDELRKTPSKYWSLILHTLSSLNEAEKQETWWRAMLSNLSKDEIEKLPEENLPLFWMDLNFRTRLGVLKDLKDETIKKIASKWLEITSMWSVGLSIREILLCVQKDALSQEQIQSIKPEWVAGIFHDLAHVEQQYKELIKKLYMQLSGQQRDVVLKELNNQEISKLYCEQMLVDIQTHYPNRFSGVLEKIPENDFIPFINKADNLAEGILLYAPLTGFSEIWRLHVVLDAAWKKLITCKNEQVVSKIAKNLNVFQLADCFPILLEHLQKDTILQALELDRLVSLARELSPENEVKLYAALGEELALKVQDVIEKVDQAWKSKLATRAKAEEDFATYFSKTQTILNGQPAISEAFKRLAEAWALSNHLHCSQARLHAMAEKYIRSLSKEALKGFFTLSPTAIGQPKIAIDPIVFQWFPEEKIKFVDFADLAFKRTSCQKNQNGEFTFQVDSLRSVETVIDEWIKFMQIHNPRALQGLSAHQIRQLKTKAALQMEQHKAAFDRNAWNNT